MYSLQTINPFLPPSRSCGRVMFLHLSVILFTGGVSATHTPGPEADTPQADTPQADTPQPPAQWMLGYTPPCTVHAGIWSTSGRYTFHWNAFLLFLFAYLSSYEVISEQSLTFRRQISGELSTVNTFSSSTINFKKCLYTTCFDTLDCFTWNILVIFC